jgi:hypothetical protein
MDSVTSFHVSSNAAQSVKSSAGKIRAYFLDNSANTATTYYQFFFIASGSVTVGTTPATFVIPVPAGLGANMSFVDDGAVTFPALSFAATTTYNGSTAPASAVDCTIFFE